MKGIFQKLDLRVTAKYTKGFFAYPPMFHAHSEIIYVISGSVRMMIDDIPHTLTANEMSIAFPYSIHSYEKSNDAETVIILFAPSAAGAFEKTLSSCKPELPYIKNAEAFLPLLKKICAYARSDNRHCRKTAAAYLEAVVGEICLASNLINIQETDLNTTQKILVYCSDHYKEEISVKSVAAALYVSERTITKIFSSKLNCSFREFINSLRIIDAKNLLKSTELRIIDIMYECGFRNQSSFNRIFYQDCGMTPKDYREQNQNK